MNYNLNRLEYNKDKDGTIVSIFIAVGITDDLGNSLTQEHWLSSEEMASVLLDEKNLTPILKDVASDGVIRLEQEVLNRPQPPIIADEVKRNKFFPNPKFADILAKVETKKLAKIEAEKVVEPIVEKVITEEVLLEKPIIKEVVLEEVIK